MGFHIDDMFVPISFRAFNRHCRFYYNKHGEDISAVSRKTKKFILGGKKMGKAELKKRIAAVQVTIHKYPREAELSDYFCPKCGCTSTRSTGNMADWPERWSRIYCLRCGYLVGESDNSPYVHVLELMCGPEKEEFDERYWG